MSISLDSITFPSISGPSISGSSISGLDSSSPPVNGPEQIVGTNSNSYVIPLAFIVIIVVIIAYYILFSSLEAPFHKRYRLYPTILVLIMRSIYYTLLPQPFYRYIAAATILSSQSAACHQI